MVVFIIKEKLKNNNLIERDIIFTIQNDRLSNFRQGFFEIE